MTTHPTRRRGFTLIELLVVMALIAILAAIAAGAFFRVRASSEVSSTQSTLEKLNAGIDRKWKAVLDNAAIEAKNTPASFQNFCGNDPDRIRIVYTYLKLKHEFPTTFEEATTPVTLAGLTLPPRTGTFAPLTTTYTRQPTSTQLRREQDSAACLFLILTATGSGGEVFDVTPLQSQVDTVAGVQMFVDAWGRPIIFVRQAYLAELNGPPYLPASVTLRDPLDPIGRLTQFTTTWTTTSRDTFWTEVRRDYMPGSGHGMPRSYSGTVNWVPTCVSGGPNEDLSQSYLGSGTASDPGNDNLISFRLRRAGAKGN
jgi:prepilin-type N-terminal cleavage/methylation domain-containing protein